MKKEKSIMHTKANKTCYLCAKLHDDYTEKPRLEAHHVIFNAHNRKLSDKYGLIIYLCPAHHTGTNLSASDNYELCKEAVHINPVTREMTCKAAQMAFITQYPDEDFVKIFGRNYL